MLLADEPTGNLDTRTSIEVMGIFQRLNRDRASRCCSLPTSTTSPSTAHASVAFRDGVVVRPPGGRAAASRRTAGLPAESVILRGRHVLLHDLRIALKALARNKMRTALTMLGMIIGVVRSSRWYRWARRAELDRAQIQSAGHQHDHGRRG